MKKRKVLSILLAVTLAAGVLAGCGDSNADTGSTGGESQAEESAESTGSQTESEAGEDAAADTDGGAAAEGADFSGVSITMLNTKSEIQPQLEAAAEEWGALTGAALEVYTIGGDSSPAKERSDQDMRLTMRRL